MSPTFRWAFALSVAWASSYAGSESCESPWRRVRRLLEKPLENASGVAPFEPAVDCPDGLARCEDGRVLASKLATRKEPCRAGPSECACPWEPIETCAGGCVAEGLEVVMERTEARRQLCVPSAADPPFARPALQEPGATVPDCEEGERYRCVDSVVVDCEARNAIARCLRGCVAPASSIDREGASREASFAILCSR